MISKLVSLVNFLGVKAAVRGAARAPILSLSSLSIVGRLKAMQIVPSRVVDVGANRGQFSGACLAILPSVEILALEPIPEVFARLERSLSRFPNVALRRVAAGKRRERRIFHVNEYSHSSSFLSVTEMHRHEFPHARKSTDIEVDVVPLDDLRTEGLFDKIDLLKLDVQGFEMEVLEGATQTLAATDYLIIETSFKPMYENELMFSDYYEYLRDRGFEFIGPAGFLTSDRAGEIVQMDGVFARRGRRDA